MSRGRKVSEQIAWREISPWLQSYMPEQDVVATLLPLRKMWSSGDDLTDSLGAGCQTRKQKKV
jgi:hypothetical protein